MGNKITPNQTGVHSLPVFELPVEFNFKIAAVPLRVLGYFAVNLDGEEHARAIRTRQIKISPIRVVSGLEAPSIREISARPPFSSIRNSLRLITTSSIPTSSIAA